MNKANSNSYTSFPIGIVNLVAMNFLLFPMAMVVLANIFDSWSGTWLTGIGTLLLLNLITIGSNYSSVKGNKSKITVSSLTKSITVDNVTDIKAWWCYDLSGSGTFQQRGETIKMKQSASKINCIVKFSSKTASVYILEEIHLGEKFPNHLPYSVDEAYDTERTLVVWDVDNCLLALGIRLESTNPHG